MSAIFALVRHLASGVLCAPMRERFYCVYVCVADTPSGEV